MSSDIPQNQSLSFEPLKVILNIFYEDHDVAMAMSPRSRAVQLLYIHLLKYEN